MQKSIRVFPGAPVSFSGQSLISHAGTTVLTGFINALGFQSLSEDRLGQFAPAGASHRPGRLVGSLAVLAAGGEHVSDLDMLRSSPGVFGPVASNATMSRFFDRAGQNPEGFAHGFETLTRCADSRPAAEIIFDLGLGDVFVVRTAGHVIDDAVLGSLEYSISVLNVPLIVILGHDNCGAVTATKNAVQTGEMPWGFIRDLVERIAPSVLNSLREDKMDVNDMVVEHVKQTAPAAGEFTGDFRCRGRFLRLSDRRRVPRLEEGRAQLVSAFGGL